MRADLAIFFNPEELGEKIIYNGVEITAIPDMGESNAKGNTFTNDGSADRAFFEVTIDDVPSPSAGDEIVYMDKTWEVARIVESDTITHRLACISNQSAMR